MKCILEYAHNIKLEDRNARVWRGPGLEISFYSNIVLLKSRDSLESVSLCTFQVFLRYLLLALGLTVQAVHCSGSKLVGMFFGIFPCPMFVV